MAKKRRKTKRSKKKVLNKWHIGLPLIFLGFLYYFVFFMSPNSLAYDLLYFLPGFFFGKLGTYIFYLGILILGIWIIIDETILKKSPFKKFFLLLFTILPILTFPVLEHSNLDPTNYGGNLGYVILYFENVLFSSQINAIKIFSIILFLGAFLLVFGKFLFSLFKNIPKFEVQISEQKTSNKDVIKEQKIKKSESEKTSLKKDFKINDDSVKNRETEKNVLKQLIKAKLEEKLKEKTEKKQLTNIKFPQDKPTFDVNLLDSPETTDINVNEEFLMEKAKAVEEKLAEFNIPVKVEGFNIGPTVLQIKIKPEAGISISRIESKKKDLAMALKVKFLRILAPIPGTEYVGIEIPNPNSRIVRLREILESPEFIKSMSKNTTNLALGISIDGKKIIKQLDKMPHLLVAGATGSGKSVGINDFILSLIYQNSPSELKFIMVDPKQVELGMYEGIPYLLSPIITEPEKAVKVLKWAVQHMEERYSMLREKRVKKLEEYNKKVPQDQRLPRIVIIIDELADLMMASGNRKDTETAIARIAQKARAVGMHLIVATQRPSVNVITGIIKANIPTRIAFGVISQVDSRTILDMKGAEDLMGRGDLLYIDPTTKFPLRIQAPFVSTEEIDRIVEYIKEKYMKGISEEEIYNQEIMNILNNKAETAGGSDISPEDEELVQQAIEIIRQTRRASATLLQRKLGIGFARAARIMDILEERGIVGPQEGSKPREIYI